MSFEMSEESRYQCDVCGSVFKNTRALSVHSNCSRRCDDAYEEKSYARMAKKRVRPDTSALEDFLEDDPPEDWNTLPSMTIQADLEATERVFQQQYANNTSCRSSPPPHKRRHIEEVLDNKLIMHPFPRPAGTTYGMARTSFEELRCSQERGEIGQMGPFKDRDEWEFAEWLFKSGVSQEQMDKCLKLNITRTRTCLSFKDKRSLLAKIDALPKGHGWTKYSFNVTGDILDYNGDPLTEEITVWARDAVECVKELIGNPMFREHLKYTPEKLYGDKDLSEEIINEMWTAEWWWEVQERLPEGATIAPVIFASDKTQLTQFIGDKQAWPVYLTIGNISKDIRKKPSKRAVILLGYLPVAKLECLSDKTKQGAAYRIFHQCMSKIVEPLIEAGKNGILMTCADGYIRRVFPILAAYVADFPEQCLIACVKENTCPICEVPSTERGEPKKFSIRDVRETCKALASVGAKEGPLTDFSRLGLRPVPMPFWANLPESDIFSCFTPDLLHQLHKGVFKDHLVKWCIELAGKQEVDKRFQKMPSHPTLRHFKKGISSISQWTGREYKEMEKIFASLIYGAVDKDVTAVARAVVDFIYYASFQSHSTETLWRLQDALNTFHEFKDVFIRYGVRAHFQIPKIHAMEHYVDLIRSKGTADGFNTELSERLHIDCAKLGYRASNKKNYEAQMIKYLSRHETLDRFAWFLIWTEAIDEDNEEDEDNDDEEDGNGMGEEFAAEENQDTNTSAILTYPGLVWRIAKEAPWPRTSVRNVIKDHSAVDLIPALSDYLKKHVPECVVVPSEADKIDVYKRIATELPSLQGLTNQTTPDIIRATPEYKARGRKYPEPAHFDTVLVHLNEGVDEIGLEGHRAARVRVFFRLPPWFHCSDTLAYVEWFTPFTPPEMPLRMSQVSWAMKSNGSCQTAVINISSIRCSCYLTPYFGNPGSKRHKMDFDGWSQSNIMDKCTKFIYNSQISLRMFQLCDGDYVLDTSE